MNYKIMLDRVDWDLKKGKDALETLGRILSSLRLSLSEYGSTINAGNEYKTFWDCITEHNVYMCALLLKKAEKLYGPSDFCVKTGLSVLKHELEKNIIEDDVTWKLLAEIEMNFAYHIPQYTRIAVNNNMLKKAFKYLQYSTDLSNAIVFFLHSISITPDNQFRRSVFEDLMPNNWAIEVSAINNRQLLSVIIDCLVQSNDIASLINILDLCVDLKFSDVFKKSQTEWKEYLLSMYQPISMILYRKILKREGVSNIDVLNELYCFTSFHTKNPLFVINDSLYFSYAIREFPEKYDYYSGFFNDESVRNQNSDISDTEFLSDNLAIENTADMLNENFRRYFNYLIVDKPFRTLIQKNPDKVISFLDIIGSLSLYHNSRSDQYKKRLTWVESGYCRNDYKNYLDFIASKYSPSEVLYIYMNSPLKSMIDIAYVIRLLFMPKMGYTDLTAEFDRYTFRGKLIKTSNSNTKISYQVSMSNACTSYHFPIHHSWTSLHMHNLENNFTVDDIVYFKIMSLNSKGMIFVYDVTQKPPSEKKESHKKEVKSEVIKNLDMIIDGTLPLQGKNVKENIRLFSLAMICDNNRILVELKNKNGIDTEYLPCLPVANIEDSGNTIKRLLKYYTGFSGDITVAPCGIRHLCTGYNKRSVFFIYKIMVSDLKEAQGALALKSSMTWRNIEEYKENMDNFISESFIGALDASWSEYILTV